MRIWVDVDGVLADFVPMYLGLIQEHTGRTHSVYDVTSFNFFECVASKDEDAHVWREMIDKRPGLLTGLAEVPGALAGVAELRERGSVAVLTSPHIGPYWMHERCQWLLARGFAKRDIVFASDKSHVRGDILIDDSAANCEAWAHANQGGVAILLDAPWNRRPVTTLKDGRIREIRRARGWDDVVRCVKRELRMISQFEAECNRHD